MIGVLIDTNDRIIAALENYDAVSLHFHPSNLLCSNLQSL